MEFKVGDKVKITRRDGEGKSGVIIKVSNDDPKFKYCVAVNGKEYWKEEKSLDLIESSNQGWIKPLEAAAPVTTATPKKRGRPKGVTTTTKQKSVAKPKKAKQEPVQLAKEEDIFDRYHGFMKTLSLNDFLEIHRLINQDYAEMCELVQNQLGLRGVK